MSYYGLQESQKRLQSARRWVVFTRVLIVVNTVTVVINTLGGNWWAVAFAAGLIALSVWSNSAWGRVASREQGRVDAARKAVTA
jgi:hypothetical protein